MGCLISRLEHLAWSRYYDKVANAAPNGVLLRETKGRVMQEFERLLPRELDRVKDDKGNVIGFKGMALSGKNFFLDVGKEEGVKLVHLM